MKRLEMLYRFVCEGVYLPQSIPRVYMYSQESGIPTCINIMLNHHHTIVLKRIKTFLRGYGTSRKSMGGSGFQGVVVGSSEFYTKI
jgi:hypothetical protein